MKKNFFKKLSFVLALAMIVTALAPAAGAFAAKAPKLSATTKYLYLDVDGKNVYDFNISNKVTGWKYLWSSANEDVAEVNAKNGVTTATGAGKTTVSVVITDKDGEEFDELTATVIVRDNIKELTITNLPTDGKVAVGVAHDFNRSYVTVANKTKGTSGITRWSVDSTDATITDMGVFTATKAGEYTITARAFQSKAKYTSWLSDATKYASYVTAETTYKVTVAASMTGVKQTALATAQVTFDSAMTDVDKNISVYQVVGATKVKQLVKEVKMDDAKKVATVTMYVNFTPEATYVVDYTGMKSVQFVSARTKAEDVKSVEVSTKTAVLNTAKVVEFKLFNADGVDITTPELKTRVTMTSTGEAYTSFVSGNTLYMYKKDVTTTVKAVYHTYKYNATTGVEEGNLEATGVITCVESDPTNVTGLNAWTIKGVAETPDYSNVKHTIAAGDLGKKLFVKLNTLTGTTTGTVDSVANSSAFEFTSSDQSVLMVYGTGSLVANKEGTAVIVVKYGTGSTKTPVATIEVTVGAKRAASQFSLSSYEFTLSSNVTLDDTKDLTITLKDQLGDDFAYTTYDAEKLSGPASAVLTTGTGLTPLTGGKIRFDGSPSGAAATEGTYVYKITVKDISRVVTVVVTNPSEATAQYYRLDLSATNIDLKAAAEKVNKDVAITVYGYANNGIKVTKETLNTVPSSNTGFKVEVDAPSADINYDETNNDGTFDLVTSTSGGAIVKRPVGSYKVTAYRWDSSLATPAWVPVDTQFFATTDTQVAPVLAEIKTKLHDTVVASYTATEATLIAAVKECYKITLDGADVTANIVSVEANGTYASTYVTSVTIRTNIVISDANSNTAYLEQKLTIGDYITKK